MTIDEKEEEIGLCSEIINKASLLQNGKLRSKIFENVLLYRQELRDQVILERYNSDLKEVKKQFLLQRNEGE